MMIMPTFTDYGLDFTRLSPREDTEMIVIHHTGGCTDDDLSAEDIHRMHLMNGWAGCGYHYIVRKNGEIEIGRPFLAVGAHAEGRNWNSIGIHVCGNFEIAQPTDRQIEALSYLVGWLADKYDISCTPDCVVGHRDLMPTACPGQHLYDILQTIRGKAIWYMQHYQEGD